MKHCLLFCITILCLLCACNDSKNESNQKTAANDSTFKTEIDVAIPEDSSGDQELKEIVYAFEKMAKDTFIVDSLVFQGADTLRFLFKHYADREDSILIPDKYTAICKFNNYRTPIFVSSLSITKNGTILIDTSYSKKIFSDYLPEELEQYGVLLYPNLYFEKKGVSIKYSISIPLTDVGRGAALFIDYNGRLEIKEK